MTKETFGTIWAGIKSWCEAYCSEHKQVRFNEASEVAIRRTYEACRNNFKKRWMKDGEESFIDRHKIAACLVIAIVSECPLKIKREYASDAEAYEILLCNEWLAIRTALAVLSHYIRYGNGLHPNTPRNANLRLPSLPCRMNIECADSYMASYCKELYINSAEGTLSVASIANELFLIECFNNAYNSAYNPQNSPEKRFS